MLNSRTSAAPCEISAFADAVISRGDADLVIRQALSKPKAVKADGEPCELSLLELAQQTGLAPTEVANRIVELAGQEGMRVIGLKAGHAIRVEKIAVDATLSKLPRCSDREWQSIVSDPGRLSGYCVELMPLVKQACSNIAQRKRVDDFDDLLQNGRVALFHILQQYVPSKGPLEPYVRRLLPLKIITEWRAERPLKLSLYRRAKEIEQAREELQATFGGAAEKDEELIASRLALSRSTLVASQRAIAAARAQASFSADGRDLLLDLPATPRAASDPVSAVCTQDFLEGLSLSNRRMVELRLLGVTQSDIAYVFNLSEAEVRERLAVVRGGLSEGHRIPEDAAQKFGLGYSVLRREYEVLQRLPTTWPELLPYVDGLGFFQQLRGFRGVWCKPILTLVCGDQETFCLERLPEESQRAFRFLIRLLNPSLDEVRFHPLYQELLSLPRERWLDIHGVATELVRRGIMDWRRPLGAAFCVGGSQRSRHLQRAVVGSEDRVALNRRSFVREHYQHLDQISQSSPSVQGLAALLGIGGSRAALAAKLVALGDLSPKRPPKLPPFRPNCGTLSYYLDERVVGEEWAWRNFVAYFKEACPHVDAVKRSKLFLKFLGLTAKTDKGVAQCAVQMIPDFDCTRPPGYPLTRLGVTRSRILSYLYDPSVVPMETARANLVRWAQEGPKSDAELRSKLLARAINLTRMGDEQSVPEEYTSSTANRAALASRSRSPLYN